MLPPAASASDATIATDGAANANANASASARAAAERPGRHAIADVVTPSLR